MTDKFKEYMKLHLISLQQDMDPLDKTEIELIHLDGQIKATEHLLSVANDMMSSW